jgi:Holliday junction DNA helicase RuvA
MIGYLKGTLLFLGDDTLIIDVGGVGYEVHPTLDAMGSATPGDDIEVFVHTLVREDDIRLFAFATLPERALFEELTRVSGVGAKSALLIISQLGEEGFVEAVLTSNPLPLTRIKGIGKRIAERVLLEMKDRVDKLYKGGVALSGTGNAQPASRVTGGLLEVQEALLQLGFKRPQVSAVMSSLADRKDAPVEELIREALKRLR